MELLRTAVLHLASRPGFAAKQKYLQTKGLWQSGAPFGNATMPLEDVRAEATRGVAHFNATFLRLGPQVQIRKKVRKEERKYMSAEEERLASLE